MTIRRAALCFLSITALFAFGCDDAPTPEGDPETSPEPEPEPGEWSRAMQRAR